MRPSHPTAFVYKKRDSCAVCNNIAPCPVCPKGQQCQQIFRSSCQDCPVNKCVPIPGYSSGGGGSGGALGGGLAALVIIAIGGAVAFWFWRRLKAKRRRIALHEDAMERREKVKNEKEATTLQLGGGAKPNSGDPNSPFVVVDEDELDGDTEYTQVTGVLNNHGEDGDRLGSLAEPTAFRRRSFGAATHLSRITEGAEEEEEEEEEEEQLASSGNARASSAGRKRNTAASLRSNTRSFASGAGPRVSVGSGTSFGSHNIIPIAFKPSATASASANGGESDSNDIGYESISPVPLPSTAHRATGAPAIQVNTARQGPIRPTRAPDLNLRLPETQRSPHKPTTSSPLAATASSSSAVGVAEGEAEPYGFMSIDPVEALTSSGPYSRHLLGGGGHDRHLSVGTINTIGSTHSGSLSYVLSAPQVITPVSAEGVRRVQLGNGGKAQLVKVPSLKRKDNASSAAAKASGDPFQDQPESELLPPPTNRFGGAVVADRSSTVSTSTLGIPFGENPFGPSPPINQTSPSDASDPRSSWLDSTILPEKEEREETMDPFSDPHPTVLGGEGEGRASIGGLSLLGQFPFDFGNGSMEGGGGGEATPLPEDALKRVERFK